uniref:Uncharacterized protein n=1 Tax=Thermogemmatispora argillosa TaxID=2045280 RepID=A0A455SZZ7_9CHLR|nr:hypothetical protein KTA_13570 [Thermogemmatispora argillosa]
MVIFYSPNVLQQEIFGLSLSDPLLEEIEPGQEKFLASSAKGLERKMPESRAKKNYMMNLSDINF